MRKEFKEIISNEELIELPLRHFEGTIHIIESSQAAREVAQKLAEVPLLGFDTETKPSFRKGQVHHVALLQLSTAEEAFLFRINHFDLPAEVFQLLSNPSIIKAGAAIRDDIKALKQKRNFAPKGFVELQDLAKDLGINAFSLKKLSGIVLGFRISKAQQLSNWDADDLNEAQILYAATDAWVSYEIYKHLNNGFQPPVYDQNSSSSR